MTSNEVLKLIDAGFTKAEIDALMIEKATETVTEKATETVTEKATETETATDTTSTVNDNVSNLALLTAINNLTKAVQESNRNNITSDGNTQTPTTESVTDIMSKMFK